MEEKKLSTRCWEYLMTTCALLKIAGMIFAGLTFGFSLAAKWNLHGGAWVEFTSLNSLMTAGVWFFVNMCRKEPNRLAEMICDATMCTMLGISGVVSAIKVNTYGTKLVLCSVFCFTAFLVFAVDLAIMYRQFNWNTLLPTNQPAATATITTTTTTTTPPKSKSKIDVAQNTGQ